MLKIFWLKPGESVSVELKGEVTATRDALQREVRAWAIMGMNVFLGLRFSVWGEADPAKVAADANAMIAKGIER